MHAWQHCSVALGALMLGGCAFLPLRTPPELPLLPAQALGVERNATQVLHVAWADHEMTLQCALNAARDSDTLIAVGPLGQRLFTLHYDASGVHAQAGQHAPKNLPARRIWADVELALWPLAAWQRRLQETPWKLTVPESGVRRLRYGGQLVSEIHYNNGSNGWNGRFWLVDWVHDYALDVTSTSNSDKPVSRHAGN